jgi:hypothetical protein
MYTIRSPPRAGLSFFPQLLIAMELLLSTTLYVAIGPRSFFLTSCIPQDALAKMSGEKRPAPEAFGTSHQLVVKRNKADAELNPATTLVKGSSQNGALVQSVCAIVALKAWKKQLANRSLQVPRTSGLDAPIMELTGEILLLI